MSKANVLKGVQDRAEFVGCRPATVIKHERNHPGRPISLESGRRIGGPEKPEAFYKDLAAGGTERWV